MWKLKNLTNEQRGSILLVIIITMPFLILIAIYYTNLAVTSFQVARFDQLHTEAQLAADAGADYSVEALSINNNWTGTTGQVTLHSDSQLKTTFTSTVTGSSSAKTIAITGYTYWPAGATTPTRSVSIYVDLYPVTNGNYSLVTGAGGLVMANNSKIVGGNVLINGSVSLSNSAQIGLSTNAATIQVADQTCPNPVDATYPRVCNAGENGQPITMSNSAHIYGTVNANNQTNGTGMSNPGLESGTPVTPQSLPSYNRSAQKAAVSNSMTGAAASCNSNNGTLTWPANTKITGDVTIAKKCVVTVAGNVWITGSLTLNNSAQLVVANSLNTTMPVVMVDGSAGISFNQSAVATSNNQSTGIEFITYYSTASCSPDCSSVTGTDLANSRLVTTLQLNNSSSGPNSIFYAYWTQVTLGNSGQIGAVIGQTVNLSNTAAITFGTSTGGLGYTTWIIKGYRRQ